VNRLFELSLVQIYLRRRRSSFAAALPLGSTISLTVLGEAKSFQSVGRRLVRVRLRNF
jgi:hypothetical protein